MQSLVLNHDMANSVGALTICESSIQYPAPTANMSSLPAQDLGMVLFLAISGTLFHNVAMDKICNALLGTTEAEISTLIAGTSSAAYKALFDDDEALVIPEIPSSMKTI